jgi:hypothetical protein
VGKSRFKLCLSRGLRKPRACVVHPFRLHRAKVKQAKVKSQDEDRAPRARKGHRCARRASGTCNLTRLRAILRMPREALALRAFQTCGAESLSSAGDAPPYPTPVPAYLVIIAACAREES